MRINNLRYNAQSGAFMASVDIQRDGRMFRYPCELPRSRTVDGRRNNRRARRLAFRYASRCACADLYPSAQSQLSILTRRDIARAISLSR